MTSWLRFHTNVRYYLLLLKNIYDVLLIYCNFVSVSFVFNSEFVKMWFLRFCEHKYVIFYVFSFFLNHLQKVNFCRKSARFDWNWVTFCVYQNPVWTLTPQASYLSSIPIIYKRISSLVIPQVFITLYCFFIFYTFIAKFSLFVNKYHIFLLLRFFLVEPAHICKTTFVPKLKYHDLQALEQITLCNIHFTQKSKW